MMRRSLLVLLFLAVAALPAFARGGGGCFVAGTPITLADGRTVPIESVRAGDTVLAWDGVLLVSGRVAQTFVRSDERFELVIGTLTLGVTGEHPLAVADGGFRRVDELAAGDTVLVVSNGAVVSQPITSLHRVPGVVTVYNLEVEGPHTYVAAGVVVHNKGGGGGGHGGGGGFGGGGYSFGGGGRYGSGSGNPASFLVMLAIGIPFFLISCVKWARENQGKSLKDMYPQESGTHELDFRVEAPRAQRRHEETLGMIQKRAAVDGRFEPVAMEALFRETFVLLQKCWQERDYTALADRLTTKLLSQHRDQLDGLRRAHEINVLDHLTVRQLWFFRLTSSSNEAEVTVLFEASVRDYYTDDRDGRFLRGDSHSEVFQEFWTFRWGGGRWLLAHIGQVSDSSKAWSPSKVSSDQAFVPISDTALEAAMERRAVSEPWWAPGPLREQVSFWAARRTASREIGSSTLDPADFAPAVWKAFTDELAQRTARLEEIVYRNFCVREVRVVFQRSASKTAPAQVVFEVSTHAQTERRRGGVVVELEPDLRITTELWTLQRADRWVVTEIKKS